MFVNFQFSFLTTSWRQIWHTGTWSVAGNEAVWTLTWRVSLLSAGAPDGRIQHRCPGVEAELLRHVRAGQKQRINERILAQGLICTHLTHPTLCPFLSKSIASLVTGKEILAWPQQCQGGSGGQWHQAHQRPRHPRGLSLRDHVRGAELDHAGHPHRRAGDHRGRGQSVYGSRARTEVKKTAEKNRQDRSVDHRVSCFSLKPLHKFTKLTHLQTCRIECRLCGCGVKKWKGPKKLCTNIFLICHTLVFMLFFGFSFLN